VQPYFVLIDYENVHVKSLALLKGEQFHVRVFLGKSNTKIHSELAIAMQKLGNRGDYVMLESSGSNALDFHIAYYLGVLASADPAAQFHIISKDTGFDPLVAHLKSRAIQASRSASIEAMPCFDAAPKTLSEQQSAGPPIKKAKRARSTKSDSPSAVGKTSAALEARIQAVIENLKNRRSARPTKMATLLNTIHAKIGKAQPLAEAEALRDVLVDRGYVLVNGLRVTYDLPTRD
jgi:PIN domain